MKLPALLLAAAALNAQIVDLAISLPYGDDLNLGENKLEPGEAASAVRQLEPVVR